MSNRFFMSAGKRCTALLCAFMLLITTVLTGNVSNVKAATVSATIDGFQISAVNKGFRTVYSFTNPGSISKVGLIYGLEVDNSDMFLGSTHRMVKCVEATTKGILSATFSGDISYAMTMELIDNVKFLNGNLSVRAFAKLKDGTVTYSDVENVKVYDVAKNVYTTAKMPNKASHDYVYTVLKKVNPNEPEVEYVDWNGIRPEDPTESQSQTQTTSQTQTNYVTANQEWNNGDNWSVYFATEWGGNPTGAYIQSDSMSNYGVRIDKSTGIAWSVQVKSKIFNTNAGHKYRMTVNANSSKAADGNVVFKDEISGKETNNTVVAGNNTFSVEFDASTTAQAMFDLGKLPAGTEFKITGFALEDLGSTQPGTTAPSDSTTKTQEAGDINVDWNNVDYLGDGVGGYGNTFKAYSTSDKVGIVNIQQPGFVSKPGIYMTFPAGVGSVSLPNGSYHIEGASIIVFVDSIASGVTTFKVTDALGSYDVAINKTSGGTVVNPTSGGTSGGFTAPQGLVVDTNTQQRYFTIMFNNVAGATSYNLYVNNTKWGAIVNGGTIGMGDSIFGNGGTFTITVTAVSGAQESEKSSGVNVTVTGATATSQIQNPTNSNPEYEKIIYGKYPKNGDLRMPEGGVVSSPGDNEIAVVWGNIGNPNCYNVYIDDVLTWTGVAASWKSAYGYVAGTHNIKITRFSNNQESEPATFTIDVAGATSGVEPTTPRSYINSNKNYSDPVPVAPQGVQTQGKNMYVKINNRSNGKYTDAQCYWVLIGLDANKKYCYVDANGNAVPMKASDNTVRINDRMVANYAHSLAECSFFYAPTTLESGRLYLSYERPVYLTVNDGGYAGPDTNNSSDPNYNTHFEFAEFTLTNGHDMFTNTTRVDFFDFPIATRLIGDNGCVNGQGDADHFDLTVGDMGTRQGTIDKFLNEAPSAAWKTCYDGLRIYAPCKKEFNTGRTYGDYYDSYINEFWDKYSREDLTFKCDMGVVTGRTHGDVMIFTKQGGSKQYYVYKPTSQDVLEGRGNFDRTDVPVEEDEDRHRTELAIEAQLCAAFVRGVATQPEHWSHEAYYYNTDKPSNYYAGFFHKTHYDGFAYGFCYDDVFDHSTLLHYTNATGLIVDMKW